MVADAEAASNISRIEEQVALAPVQTSMAVAALLAGRPAMSVGKEKALAETAARVL